MEGLRLGLMPLGETLGSTLPRKKIAGIPCLPTSLAFGFVLGAFATFAEPAIGVLRAAGSGVDPTLAPLLWTILNTGATNLVNSVGVGVGIAVLLGVLRFYKGWSLKPFIYVGVIVLSVFTLWFQFSDARLQHVLGLAWDCGAVTTGPVTSTGFGAWHWCLPNRFDGWFKQYGFWSCDSCFSFSNTCRTLLRDLSVQRG